MASSSRKHVNGKRTALCGKQWERSIPGYNLLDLAEKVVWYIVNEYFDFGVNEHGSFQMSFMIT